MPSNRSSLTLALLAFVPSLALAHGEEVLLFPIGTLAAVAAILLIAFARSVRWPIRISAGVMAFVASVPFWFIPGNYFPSAVQHTGWGNFVVGFFPSLAAGVFVIWLFRGAHAVHNGA